MGSQYSFSILCYLAYTHTHSLFFLSVTTSLTFWLPSPTFPFASLSICLHRGLQRGCSSVAVEGAPLLCLSRAVWQQILSPCAVLLTAGRGGWTPLSGLPGSDSSSSNSGVTMSSSVGHVESLSKWKALSNISQAGGHWPHVLGS